MVQKKLLMLNAKLHEVPFILAARKLGFYVITTGTKADDYGHRFADEYICADYSNLDGMVEFAKKLQIDAVSWGCSDNCALTAAYIGEKLGLKGHDTYKNTEIIHRKDAFKKFAAEHQIRTPISHSFSDPDTALAYSAEADYPLIVKPTDMAGGQGVSVAENAEEYREAVGAAFERSRAKKIVVERFLRGTLHSLNTFILDQKVVSWCTANDYSYKNAYMTNSGIAPADNWEKAIEVLIPETERVAKLLGLVDGQLHMQYIMEDGEPWIIEMMRRNIGNNWMTMLTDSTGVNWPEWVIRAEAGMDCRAIPKPRLADGFYGYHMMMSDRNGIFKGIEIAPEFEKYIYQFTQWEEPGYVVEDFLSAKLGNLVFHFKTEEEKARYMPRINEYVKVICE